MVTGLRVVSYGGGVQSTALLVLAAQRRIDYPLFLMANVGDDSEHPATLEYVRNVAIPYATQHGIHIELLQKRLRDGTVQTVYGKATNDTRSIGIPVRMTNGAPANRACTADFKIAVVGKWLKAHGASADNPATVAMGISADEISRANTSHAPKYERVVYPLIGIGDPTGFAYNRSDCQRIIAEAGLPVPPKSSCFFCPFHRPSTWQEMRREEPELFEKSAQLEDVLIKARVGRGQDPVYLTRFGIPLREAIQGDAQGVLFTEESDIDGECDSGVCFT